MQTNESTSKLWHKADPKAAFVFSSRLAKEYFLETSPSDGTLAKAPLTRSPALGKPPPQVPAFLNKCKPICWLGLSSFVWQIISPGFLPCGRGQVELLGLAKLSTSSNLPSSKYRQWFTFARAGTPCSIQNISVKEGRVTLFTASRGTFIAPVSSSDVESQDYVIWMQVFASKIFKQHWISSPEVCTNNAPKDPTCFHLASHKRCSHITTPSNFSSSPCCLFQACLNNYIYMINIYIYIYIYTYSTKPSPV